MKAMCCIEYCVNSTIRMCLVLVFCSLTRRKGMLMPQSAWEQFMVTIRKAAVKPFFAESQINAGPPDTLAQGQQSVTKVAPEVPKKSVFQTPVREKPPVIPYKLRSPLDSDIHQHTGEKKMKMPTLLPMSASRTTAGVLVLVGWGVLMIYLKMMEMDHKNTTGGIQEIKVDEVRASQPGIIDSFNNLIHGRKPETSRSVMATSGTGVATTTPNAAPQSASQSKLPSGSSSSQNDITIKFAGEYTLGPNTRAVFPEIGYATLNLGNSGEVISVTGSGQYSLRNGNKIIREVLVLSGEATSGSKQKSVLDLFAEGYALQRPGSVHTVKVYNSDTGNVMIITTK